MDEQKKKRIYSAAVVIAVMLLCILLSFMVYQMFAIGAKKRRIDALNAQIAVLEKERDETSDSIEVWLSKWKIEEVAREKGWYYSTDK